MNKPICQMNLKELLEFLTTQKDEVPTKAGIHPLVPPIRVLPNRLVDSLQMDSPIIREIIAGWVAHQTFNN